MNKRAAFLAAALMLVAGAAMGVSNLDAPLGVGVTPDTGRGLQVAGQTEATGRYHHLGATTLQTSGQECLSIGQPQNPYSSPLSGIAEGDGVLICASHAPAGDPQFTGAVAFYRRCDDDSGNMLGGDVDFGANIPNQGENSLMLEAWGTPPGGGCGFGGLASTVLIADHDAGTGEFYAQWQWLFDGSVAHPAVVTGSNGRNGYYYPSGASIAWTQDGAKDTLILTAASGTPVVRVPNGTVTVDNAETTSVSPTVSVYKTTTPTINQQVGAYLFAAESPSGGLGAGGISVHAAENWDAAHINTYLVFNSNAGQSQGERARISGAGNLLVGTTTDDIYRVDVLAGADKAAVAARTSSANTSVGAQASQDAFTAQNLDSTNGNWSIIKSLSADGSQDAAIGFQHTNHANHYADFVIATRGPDGYGERLRCTVPASDGLAGLWVAVHTSGGVQEKQIKLATASGGKRTLYVDE